MMTSSNTHVAGSDWRAVEPKVQIDTRVGTEEDRWFYCAVRDADHLDESGAFNKEGQQYTVSEGPIETVIMRTWILTPVEGT